ncbi:MAG: hypothetical protein ACJA1L_000200 [Paracoccaceae bacterium]|jgi:hypothetical protein
MLPALIAVSLVSACGGGGGQHLTPEQNAQISAAYANAKLVEVNGKTFQVAHVTERHCAMVSLMGETVPYFSADIEAAAEAATSCKAKFRAGVLKFISKDTAALDLSKISAKSSGERTEWPAAVKC